MNINYTLWGFGMTGGAITFAEIGKRLIARGHKVTMTAFDDGAVVKTPDGYRIAWDRENPIECIPVSIPRFIPRAFNYVASYVLNKHALAFEWEKVYRMIPYIPDCDVNVATFFMSTFPVYLSKKGKVQFYHMQHYEPLFYNLENGNRPKSLNPKKMLGNVLYENVLPGQLYEASLSKLAEISYTLPLNRIANCTWLKYKVMREHGVEANVINHAIKSECFYPMHLDKPSPPMLLCLGKTQLKWKGLETLASAVKLLRKKGQVRLVLYGAEKNPKLSAGFEYIYKPSFKELNYLYNTASVVVCPSFYESFPAPPLEGMAAGTPVVTTAIGVEDYAVNRRNCLVVAPKSPSDMAAAIRDILEDRELGENLVRNGLNTAKRFSWDKTTDKVEDLFRIKLEEARCQRR